MRRNQMEKMKMRFTLLVVACVMAVMAVPGILLAEDEAVGKVNINAATVEELVELKQIGPEYAKKIVEYREKNGPFKNPEDIMEVSGIGEKTWEKNKERITTK